MLGGVDGEPAMDPLIGEVIASRYRVEAHVGDGSMGSVYRARHVKVGRPFALKVMRPSLTGDPGLRRRFLREAELAGGLHHPGIVAMVDLGETSTGLCYLVMEYAAGDTLYDLIVRSAPLPAARVISIVRQLCDGLAHAHDHGLIHRDLKPENVVVEPDPRGGDRMKIIDFGIAILRDDAVSTSPERLTTAGLVLGTPHYMAPEQAMGDAIDHRVDLFALGVMCFEMLTGRAPFDGDGVEVAHANASIDTPAMRARAPELVVDPLLEAFTRRLMSKSRDARPGSAAAARALLDLIELDRTAAAAMLEVPLAAADTRNVLWAPRQPVAMAAAIMQTAVPVPLDPQDECTELTRAVTPRRAPVAAASAIAVLAVVMVIVVAIAAQRPREPEAAPPRQAPISAAMVASHASLAPTVVAAPPTAAAPAAPSAIALPATAATETQPSAAAALATSPTTKSPTPSTSAKPAPHAVTVPRGGMAVGRPRAAPANRTAGDAEVAAAAPDASDAEVAATVPSAPPPVAVAVATQPIASAPPPGALPLPTAPPASADPASVAQLYAAIGQELRALDKRRGAAADLWPVYLRIRINEVMADRALRDEVDAQLHRLHAQIVKRGDVHCETPPH
jgi:protein kinase-like protein